MDQAIHTLKADSAGFLIGGQPIKPSRTELTILERLREDIKAFRGLFAKKVEDPSDDASKASDSGGGTATVTPATPRMTGTAGVLTKALTMPELGKIATPMGSTAPAIVVNVTQPVATPKRATPERPVIDRALPKLDTNGKRIPEPAPAKPMLNKPAKNADPVTTAGTAPDATGSKVRDLLGDIKDKIGNAVDLSGSEEVDPNIKAAQEIAGVAGSALNGVKAVGGMLGTVATPVLSGAMGMIKPKSNDAPTPWFRRFYNELRGLRREESVFNKAQLRTLKEIEAKPGEGKGGGFMGMLMMLIGPLVAAIGAALTAGFGLLMKLPGMGLLAKLATKLVPAVLLPKRPITQPTTVPGAPGAPAGQTGQKKPTLWERTMTKVSGWMGKGKAEPVPATPVQEIQGPPKPPGRLAKAAGAVKRMAKVLPVLGRLMTLFSVTSSVAESEGDDNLSRGEKDKRAGSAIGGGVGGVVGGALGAMVAGPIGAIVGSLVGDKVGAIVGEEVGAWVTDLRNADIPGKIVAGWDKFASTLGEGFSAVLKKLGLSGAVDKAKETYSAAKDKAAELSLEAKRGYSQATGKPIALNEAQANVARRQAAQADPRRTDAGQPQERGFLGNLAEGAGRVAGRAASALTGKKFEGFGSDVDGHIAEASKRYGLPEDVLRGFVKMEGGWTGAMSPTGAIGTGQFVKGTWDSLAKTKDGQDIGMKTIGADFRTPNDPRFDNRTNTMATGLLAKKNADILTKAGLPATGENLYMLHNIGPGVIPALKGSNNVTPETVQAMRHNGLKDGMTATDFVGFQKGRFNQAYAEANAPNVNTANKVPATLVSPIATVKPVTVTNAAAAIPAAPATTTVVTAGARAIPQMPSVAVVPPKVPDFQPVTAGLASTMDGRQEQRPSVIVVGNKTPVGRDLSNRPLAHIVTGGLSGNS
jgi:hypothetical protein